jgi:hypothetical protein
MMPSAQAMLLWVRETFPAKFETVLARAREHELTRAEAPAAQA